MTKSQKQNQIPPFVYISGSSYGEAFKGIEKYRKPVLDALRRMAVYPIEKWQPVEGLQPTPNSVDQIRQQVEASDFFLGLYANHYGQLARRENKSIIELEYQWARDGGKPTILFLIDHKENKSRASSEEQQRIEKFKERLMQESVVNFADSPQDLASQLIVALAPLLNRHNALQNDTSISVVKNTGQVNVSVIDETDIERIVLRTLELQQARQQIEQQRIAKLDDSITIAPTFPIPTSSNLAQYQCDIFVIMPFAEEFQAVYEDIIKSTGNELGLTVKRGDNFFANHYIMDEVWFGIYFSKLVIADCTGRNPNVFYELGIAHTLGRPAILITQNVKDIPFDVAGRRFIEYEDKLAGLKRMKKTLAASILAILNTQND